MFEFISRYFPAFLIGLFALTWIAVGYIIQNDQPRVIKYDCRISEISPDFPPEVKEQCRKLRAQSGRI